MSIRIETKEKKSILQIDIYECEGKTFKRETTFVTGYAVIDADMSNIDVNNKNPIKITGYNVEDHDYQEGSACFWYFDDTFDQAEQEKIKEAWDTDWEEGLNNLGWFLMDQDIFFHGPLKITQE